MLLLALLLFTLVLRYPMVEHERYQADSYFIHRLSQSIVNEGRALWTFNSLSYIGYYPFSYPSGAPFFMAELALLTGLSVESTILVSGMLFGMMFCLGAFCIAREFLSDSRFVLVATLFMVLGSRFIDTTYWVGSARGPLVVLMILSVFVAFRASSLRRPLLLPIAVVLAFGCLALHHMAVLYFFFGVAFVIASLGADFVIKRAKAHKGKVFAIYTAIVATAIAVASFGLFEVFTDAIVGFQDESLFGSQSTFVSIVLNLSSSYTSQIGLILPVAVVGALFVYRKRRLYARRLYPLMLLISFIPLLGQGLYVAMLMTPFVAILGTIWIAKWFDPLRRNRYAVFALVAILAGSAFLQGWNVDNWNNRTYMTGDTVEVPSQVFNDANYLQYETHDEYVVSNAVVLSMQLSSIASAQFLSSGVGSILTGDTTREQVEGNVSLSVAIFPRNLQELIEYNGDEYAVERNVNSLMTVGVRFAKTVGVGSDYFSSHSHLVVVVDNNWPSTLVTQYSFQRAVFPSELLRASWGSSTSADGGPLDSYLMYQSERVSLFIVGLPV
jgi:hypothetical protein